MSNINIFDLPTLSVDNFYPDSDFVIVQRPGGGTYKILASEALSISKNVKDRKSGAHDIILEESIKQTGKNSETIIFEKENLLEQDTSWNIQIALKILGDASDFERDLVSYTPSYKKVYRNLPSIGDQRFMNISKPRNSDLINSRYLVGKKVNLLEKFQFSYQQFGKQSGGGKNVVYGYINKYVTYSVIIDTGEQNKIKLHFEREGSGPACYVEYTITLTAQI